MSKPAYSLPDRKRGVDEWVAGEGISASPLPPEPEVPAQQPRPQRRLTIDLDAELHAKFKSTCALRGTNMVDEIRAFIEKWIE